MPVLHCISNFEGIFYKNIIGYSHQFFYFMLFYISFYIHFHKLLEDFTKTSPHPYWSKSANMIKVFLDAPLRVKFGPNLTPTGSGHYFKIY